MTSNYALPTPTWTMKPEQLARLRAEAASLRAQQAGGRRSAALNLRLRDVECRIALAEAAGNAASTPQPGPPPQSAAAANREEPQFMPVRPYFARPAAGPPALAANAVPADADFATRWRAV